MTETAKHPSFVRKKPTSCRFRHVMFQFRQETTKVKVDSSESLLKLFHLTTSDHENNSDIILKVSAETKRSFFGHESYKCVPNLKKAEGILS